MDLVTRAFIGRARQRHDLIGCSETRSVGARRVLDTGRRRGVVVSGVRRMNEVNARRARLQLGWVTVFGRVYHLGL